MEEEEQHHHHHNAVLDSLIQVLLTSLEGIEVVGTVSRLLFLLLVVCKCRVEVEPLPAAAVPGAGSFGTCTPLLSAAVDRRMQLV